MLSKIIVFVLARGSLGSTNQTNFVNLTFTEEPLNFLYTIDVYVGSPAQTSKFIVS
jgi:hypothetical protein